MRERERERGTSHILKIYKESKETQGEKEREGEIESEREREREGHFTHIKDLQGK